MPTTTDLDDGQDAPARSLLNSRTSAISVIAASLATLVVIFLILNSPGDEQPEVQSIPAQPNSVSQWVAAPAKPRPAASPQPKAAPITMDDQGFVDSTARCDPQQSAVAIARTARSAMVVCRDDDGTLEYQGVRLQDGATLRLDDVRPIPTGFEARNDGTTYRLSPAELVVITGEALQSRDAIVEYRAG